MDGQHLHILWTNADPVVFDKKAGFYTHLTLAAVHSGEVSVGAGTVKKRNE